MLVFRAVGRFRWIILAFGVETQLKIPVAAGFSPGGYFTLLKSYKYETVSHLDSCYALLTPRFKRRYLKTGRC